MESYATGQPSGQLKNKEEFPIFKELGDRFTNELETQEKLLTSIENKLHDIHNTREAKEDSKDNPPLIADASRFFDKKILDLHYYNNRLDSILQKLNKLF